MIEIVYNLQNKSYEVWGFWLHREINCIELVWYAQQHITKPHGVLTRKYWSRIAWQNESRYKLIKKRPKVPKEIKDRALKQFTANFKFV